MSDEPRIWIDYCPLPAKVVFVPHGRRVRLHHWIDPPIEEVCASAKHELHAEVIRLTDVWLNLGEGHSISRAYAYHEPTDTVFTWPGYLPHEDSFYAAKARYERRAKSPYVYPLPQLLLPRKGTP